MQTAPGEATAQSPGSAEIAARPMIPPPIQDEAARQREEIGILFMGFLTGLTIGGIFLVYIVLEFARYLT